jgi:hypothetical protein
VCIDDDGLIAGLYAVRNPEKLSYMERATRADIAADVTPRSRFRAR